jgi:hypothetical protein
MALPESVTGLVEFSPVEDVLLPILREPLGPGVRVQTLIQKNQQFPLVLVRRLTSFGSGGDPRFVDFARIAIYTYAEGVEGDVDSAHLGDWGPSTGPVQYADLPVGVFRYEAIYDLEIRRPVTS